MFTKPEDIGIKMMYCFPNLHRLKKRIQRSLLDVYFQSWYYSSTRFLQVLVLQSGTITLSVSHIYHNPYQVVCVHGSIQ